MYQDFAIFSARDLYTDMDAIIIERAKTWLKGRHPTLDLVLEVGLVDL